MLLTLVRHGQTTSNATGTWQGQSESDLSALGQRQARTLAERLDGEVFDRVVCSDLTRAVQTADALGRSYVMDPAFREIDLGRWEGMTAQEVAANWPDEVEALRRGEDVPVGGGETWSDVARRVLSGVRDLAGDDPDDRVLVVTHGGVIVTLTSALVGGTAMKPRPVGRLLNTAVSQLELKDGRVRLLLFNDALHADPDGAWREADKRGYSIEVAHDVGGMPALPSASYGPLAPGRVGLVEVTGERRVAAAWNVSIPDRYNPRP